jgi:menaquinol-cytochrome c reductase iron-sulfur subunit
VAEDRRTLLKVITGVLGAGAAAVVGAPAIRALIAPLGKKTISGAGDFVAIGPLELIPEDGTPLKLPVVIDSPRDAWTALPPTEVGAVFVRREGGEVIAYSTICPHLGCGVDWHGEKRNFACPCHESAFDARGQVAAGPSPRSLDRLETRIVAGKIEVKYVRFTQGTKEKIPV